MIEKQMEEMAKDLQEAINFASQTLFAETKAFIKEYHRYHSKNDFDKAHGKNLHELEAEYLTAKGYRKASDVAREIFEEIEELMNKLDSRHIACGNPKQAWGIRNAMTEIAEFKKKYTEATQ